MNKWNANPYYPEKPETVYPEQPAVMLEGYIWRRAHPTAFYLVARGLSYPHRAYIYYSQLTRLWTAEVNHQKAQYFDNATQACNWCEMMVLTGADE